MASFLPIAIGMVTVALMAQWLQDFLRRARFDPDAATIRQLQRAGSDLTKPHNPEFFLYLPTESAARAVAYTLSTSSFATDVARAAKGADWLCKATKPMILSHASLAKLRQDLIELVKPHRGTYDGWGTEIVR